MDWLSQLFEMMPVRGRLDLRCHYGAPWRIDQGPGKPTGDAKRDALIRFVRVLAETSGTVSDAEFAAVRSAGYSDAQFVDISLAFATTAFTNVFNRINDTALDFPKVA